MNEEEENSRAHVVLVLAFPDNPEEWGSGTLERVSDAYGVAKKLKGSVQVVVTLSPESTHPPGESLARFGCEELLILRHPKFHHRDPHLVSRALGSHIPPSSRILLCPGDPQGEAIASVVAEQMGTTWVPDTLTMTVTRKGTLQLNAVLPGGKLARDYKADEVCVVACMRDGVAETQECDSPPELQVTEQFIEEDVSGGDTRLERFIPADPKKVDIRFAQKIVAAGRGAGGPEGVELLANLADDLDASMGASRVAVDLGWIPYERQVGQTGRTVRPGLYVAAGISGASHHLLGMRDSDHIIAINPDEEAPIHEVSHLSLHGDLTEIVPCVRKLLKENGHG